MAEGHTDVVIKGHDAQGTTGLADHVAQWLCRATWRQSAGAARRPSPGPAECLCSGRHGAHSGSQSRPRGPVSMVGQRGHEQLQALGVQEVGLAIRQAYRALRLGESTLVARGGQLPGLQSDGVAPFSGQKAAGLLLLALLAKAGKVCGHLLGVQRAARLLQVIQGLGDRGETSGPAPGPEEGHSDRAVPWGGILCLGSGPRWKSCGVSSSWGRFHTCAFRSIISLRGHRRAQSADRGLAISVSLTRSHTHRSTDMKHSSSGASAGSPQVRPSSRTIQLGVSQPSKITTNNKWLLFGAVRQP